MCLLLSFVVDRAGDLIVQGSNILNDDFYCTAPILSEDWRSFGFGPLKTLKAKHKALLYKRIVNGLGFNFEIGELYLTWVWVVEARMAREKKEREERICAMAMQGIVRRRLAWLRVDSIRKKQKGAIMLQCMSRRATAIKESGERRARFKGSVMIQKVARARKGRKVVEGERERIRLLMKVVEEQARKDAELLAQREKLLAHQAWERSKKKKAHEKRKKKEMEETEKARIEEEKRKLREQNIALYQARIKKRSLEKRRRMRKLKKELDSAEAYAVDPASQILPRLALAVGVEIDMTNHYKAVKKSIKKMSKGGKLLKLKLAPVARSELARMDILKSRKKLQEGVRIVVKKKKRRRRKEVGDPVTDISRDIIEEGRKGGRVGGYERNKFFLSKKEKMNLNLIDASPVKASSSDLL
ncbi:hypothetical protein TL16_g09854 [Triparma laevis f. inornata]|uniref:Uncharacterized protein n=1 Tax=Triparma laevis f. inornata TaxID=1714386 RepID=A0A9W7ENY6_9STRA|nr:hypothetical protein TL16_g09854 [Triparma laevis f. inornata]